MGIKTAIPRTNQLTRHIQQVNQANHLHAMRPSSPMGSLASLWGLPIALCATLLSPLGSPHSVAAEVCVAGAGNTINTDQSADTCTEPLLLTVTASGAIGTVNNAGVASLIDTLTNSGTITNLDNSRIITNLDNSGTITNLDNSYVIPDLTNSGTITTLTNSFSITNLDNSGTITNLDNSRSIITLDNSGTITTLNNAGFFSSIGTLTNNGTITNLDNSRLITTLTNSGTITTLSNSGSIFDLDNSGTITTFTNNGFINDTLTNSGTITTLNNNFGSGIAALNNSGTITNLNNNFKILDLDNSGTLAVAAGQTIGGTINNYNQSGTLRVGASSSANFGKLNVSGTATLQPGANIDVDVNTVNTLAVDDTLDGVITAGTLVNNAGTVAVTDNSALFNFESLVTAGAGGKVSLTVKKALTVLQAVQDSGLDSAEGAGKVLDGLSSNPGGMADTITALGKLGSAGEVAEAVGQLLPLGSASTQKATLGGLKTSQTALGQRQQGTGASSGDEVSNPHYTLWIKPLASWMNQDSRGGVSGYDADTQGLMAGVEKDLSDRYRAGIAVAYAHTQVDGEDAARGNETTIRSYQLIGYGSYALNWQNAQLHYQLDYAFNDTEGHRDITFLGTRAKSDYHSHAYHAGVTLTKSWQWQDTTITPSFALDYRRIDSDSYTEKGAGAANLRVNDSKSDELIALLAGHISHPLNNHTRLTANLGVGHDLIDDEDGVSARFTGGGAAFTTQGLDNSDTLVRAGIGLVHTPSETTEVSLSYNTEHRSDYKDHTVAIKAQWKF